MAAASVVTMNVVFHAVVPRVLVPPTMVLTIVVTLLVALIVATVMNDLAVVYDAAGQAQHQGDQGERTGRVEHV
jgi:hypothetical protein